MMNEFVVWKLRGVRILCVRDSNPINHYFLTKIKLLEQTK